MNTKTILLSSVAAAIMCACIHAQTADNQATNEKPKQEQKVRKKLPSILIEIKRVANTPPSPSEVAKCRPLLKKPATFEEADRQARAVLEMLTPEERFSLISGGIRYGIGRVGLPALIMSDGAAGLHKLPPTMKKSTAFPAPILLAATWNADLATEYGRAVAEEFRAAGIHFILGPGPSIYRVTRSGRNFEYCGEDPYLTARMTESYIKGAQDVGPIAVLKPFLLNAAEYRRRATNVIVDDRALHEIHMAGFQAGIDAGAWGVMTSYNQVNGEWTGQSKTVIDGLLRGQLGFKHIVMTDWGSVTNGEDIMQASLNLEMPWGDMFERVRDKYLGSPLVDEKVVTILRTGIASGLYELEAAGKFIQPKWISKLPQHEAVSRKIANEGVTLLKNNGILPLEKVPEGTILVTGNWANFPELGGGGTTHVTGYNNIPYVDALRNAFGTDKIVFAEAPTDEQIKQASLVLLYPGHTLKGHAGKWDEDPFQHEGEGVDTNFLLIEDELVTRCATINPRTVVYVTTGNGVQMDWADKAAAVFQAFYTGQTGALTMVDIITGKVNPSGKLPFTIEKKFEDSPAFGYDKENPGEKAYAPESILNGGVRARLLPDNNKQLHTHDMVCKEGIFVGYRWYDEKKIEPRFPFGHGLSYTTFSYANLKTQKQGDKVVGSFDVMNTGKRAGAEVAQVYVHDQKASVPRPPKELKGFKKVYLEPGESAKVRIELGPEAFQFWDSKNKKWTMEPGSFDILVGASSRDIRAQQEIMQTP